MHGRRITRDQFADAALMVGMVVRDKNLHQLQTTGFQASHHGRCITGINHTRLLAAGQQPDVIVRQRGYGQQVHE